MTNEYIRKQDAIDDLHTQLMYRMGSDDMKRRLDDWVKTLPSTDVAPVTHGGWMDAEIVDGDTAFPVQVCTVCSTFFPLAYTGGGHRFCPNCGAKMDAQGEE